MIDKLQPRKLDKDTDQKLVQKNSMVDALNVYIDENISGESGDAGVIKPIKGTTSLDFHSGDARPEGYDVDASTWRVLGSVTDEITEVVYFFCWSEDANEQGVYAWDRKGVLPYVAEDTISSGTVNSVRKIFADPIFNFNPNSFISADVVYTLPSVDRGSTGLPDNDVIIYFTDNNNEPRKLNVYRTLFATGLSSRSDFNKNDYICACPKVPMGNIDFVFENDTSVNVSNFDSAPGFQFAIQGIYHDGTHTAIGPYSDIAFPPSVVNRGSKAVADTIQHNLCKIFIPELPREIKNISILARQGNSANFIELAEVPNLGASEGNWVNEGEERHYKFYNNEVAVGVSPSEVSKIFDSVPRKAKAQAAINNRLVYGNFVEGYKPTKVGASLTPVYKARPSEGVDFSIGAIPSIVKHRGGHASGIELDVSEIPNEIDEGTVVEFAFVFAPNQNFHVYNERGSYGQTHMRGAMAGDLQGYPAEMGGVDQNDGPRKTTNTASTTADQTPARKQEYRGGTEFSRFTRYNTNEPGAFNYDFGDPNSVPSLEHMFISGDFGSQQPPNYFGGENEETVRNFFGFNYGVGVRHDDGALGQPTNAPGFLGASTANFTRGVSWKSGVDEKLIAFGTSAAAPLIIPGGQVTFRVKFTVKEDILFGGQSAVSDFVFDVLSDGASDDDRFEASIVERTYVHNVALDLIDKQSLTSNQLKLITAVADIDNNGNPIQNIENLGGNRRIPIGYFIINRADVTFSLKKSPIGADIGGHSRNALNLCIDDIFIPQDGIFTCVRKADPGSPWWAISPDTIDDYLESEEDISGGWSNWSNQVFSGTEGDSFSFIYDRRLDDGDSEAVTVGSRFLGRVRWSGRDDDALDFWPNKVEEGDVDGFKFCLLDGAGGPGGYSPGNDSAFNNYGNADQGSITGQVLFTHYGTYLKAFSPDPVADIKKVVLDDVYNMCPWTKAKKNSIGVGGVLYVEDDELTGNSNFIQMAFGDLNLVRAGNTRAGNMGLPTVKSIIEAVNSGTNSNTGYPVLAMLTGPFFTGKIGMHPISSPVKGDNYQNIVEDAYNDYSIANPQKEPYGQTPDDAGAQITAYEFLNGAMNPGGLNNIESEWLPPQVTQTTTLPYVLFNDVHTDLREDIPLFSLTYPVPIIDAEAREEIIDSTSYNERETINIPLNPDPFGASTETLSALPDDYEAGHIGFGGISLAGFNPHVEIVSSKTISSGETGKPLMSFKSNATHEFGVVYFDERGRRGPVNSLGSVYVPGYSTQERGTIAGVDGGPTFINIGFNTAPPSWAHHYKIVYSKNTSVSDFFQYSTEGAYAVATDQNDNDGTKIYMSLNYLQGHPISYSDAWGAKSQDGSPVVFQPKQGDKLRIVFYNVIANGEQRKIFPNNVVFDVVGVESLGGDVDANPLLDQSLGIEPEEQEAYNSKQGLFLVLRDNPENEGFSAAEIKNNASNWFNNVVFEIFRPIKSIDSDKRIYYEIGPTYSVGYEAEESTELVHLNEGGVGGAIEMSQGDVFFRLTPLNYKDIDGDAFINLIKEPEQTSAEDDVDVVDFFSPESEPNFVGIYTEANSASDLFESDAKSIGRPASIDRNDTERRREASMIHSDRDVPKKRKLGYSSFNPSQADDKDIDPTGGPINFMKADKDSIIVLQKNKTSSIPVDRNIISTADNEVSLVASSNVLGTPRYYAAEGGTDSPESVASSADATYFASKSMGKVFRFSGSNGVMDISAKGMKSFFRNLLSGLSAGGKIIGGFDPKKDEYLITVRDDAIQAANGIYIDQRQEPAQTFGESPGSDISINVFEGAIPEGLEGDQRFTSTANVFRNQFYTPCCTASDNPFYPVEFAISQIAADASDSFTITDDIESYLEYALDQLQTNEDFRVKAGMLNAIITSSIRAQGYPEAVVAPFSPSSGDNLYVGFLTACEQDPDPNRVYHGYELKEWATNVWGAPSAYTPTTGGTGFASEQFILDISEELDRDVDPLCSISYAELWERWKNDYSLGNTEVPWNDDGTMAQEYVTVGSSQEIQDEYELGEYALSNWSVFNDGGGVFPARINSATELTALLTNQSGVQSLGDFEQFGIPLPSTGDPDVYDVIPVIYELYTQYTQGDPSENYPLALFQFQPILVDELATFLGVTPSAIPTPFRVNGDLLNDWDSVQAGVPEQEDGGGGAD